MNYYNRLNKIIKYLEDNKKDKYIPNLFIMIKNVGDNYYRVDDNLGRPLHNPLFNTLSDDDLNNLKFKNEEEMLDYLNKRAYDVGIPIHKASYYKPELIEIVDNSYLEKYLYLYNKQ